MTHTVDQTGAVTGFFIQDFNQVIFSLLRLGGVWYMGNNVLHHVRHPNVGAAVARTFQGAEAGRNGRIRIRTAGGKHTGREGRVVTAAVVRMEH